MRFSQGLHVSPRLCPQRGQIARRHPRDAYNQFLRAIAFLEIVHAVSRPITTLSRAQEVPRIAATSVSSRKCQLVRCLANLASTTDNLEPIAFRPTQGDIL
jgi:hypothetical protein